MEVRIKHELQGVYQCRMNPNCVATIEVYELIPKIFSQKDASTKHKNVVLGFHNLLWDGKEVKSVFYDMSTSEICLEVSELEWHLCPMCHLGYEGQPLLSRKDNKTEICPKCSQKEMLDVE